MATYLVPEALFPSEPSVPVVVYHDVNAFTRGGPHRPREVYACKVMAHDLQPDDPYPLLEDAFEVFNVGDPDKDSVAREYRGRGLRSLSVGDVVRIGEVGYLCKSFNWERFTGDLEVPA